MVLGFIVVNSDVNRKLVVVFIVVVSGVDVLFLWSLHDTCTIPPEKNIMNFSLMYGCKKYCKERGIKVEG